jgi:predicted GH43/DUF377 family glycosyl hydrolase
MKLLVALSFYSGDRDQAHRLARLLADVEPTFTDVFDLLILPRWDTTVDEDVLRYCQSKFNVYTSFSTIKKVGYPAGPWSTWRGCYDWAIAQGSEYEAVMTIESDSVPLTADWAKKIWEAWKTQPNVGVMGDMQPPHNGFGCHINGNAVFSCRTDVAQAIQNWSIPNDSAPWDLFGYPVWAAFGVHDTPIIQSDFRSQRLDTNYLDRLAFRGVVWHHGCKDESAYQYAVSKVVLKKERPTVEEGGSADDLLFRYDDSFPSVLKQGLEGHLVDPNTFDNPQAMNFNPSLARLGGHTGIFYRSQAGGGWSRIRWALLSKDLKSITFDTLVSGLPKWLDGLPSHYEDPRFVDLGGVPHLSFIHSRYRHGASPGWKQCLAPVTVDESGRASVGEPVPLNYRANTGEFGNHEKNWVFFQEGQEKFFVYESDPHEVVNIDTGKVEKSFIHPLAGWKSRYGNPRGGSSPVRHGNLWVSFFHSSVPHTGRLRRYHMGAYVFSVGNKHRPLRVTKKPLLTASTMDGFSWRDGSRGWEPIVIFPAGAIFEDGVWTISAGINDSRCGIFKIPHGVLMNSLH